MGLLINPGRFDAATTISKQIDSGANDAEENKSTGAVSTNSNDLELCRDLSVFQIVGLRFTAVGIPQGATIQNAYIQFVVDETTTTIPTITIYGENVDSAAAITTTAFNLSSRTSTSATVSWSPPAWNNIGDAGVDQRTSNISSIIQEIVNRPGFTTSSNILILFNEPTNATPTRVAQAYDLTPANAPTLVVTYL
jgi:hypothetical protein